MRYATRGTRHEDAPRVAYRFLTALVVVLAVLAGCDSSNAPSAPAAKEIVGRKVVVVTTTELIGEIARKVGAEDVEVTSLMGPGVDPHLYKATHGDVQRLQGADLVLYNGLYLEGKMSEVLDQLASKKPCIAVTHTIPVERLRKPAEFEGHYDPHIWFDTELWLYTVSATEAELSRLRPDKTEQFKNRAQAYRRELEALHAWTAEQIKRIPQQSRVLVTAHDAFGYFGRAYGIEVMGLQGISTASEYGLYDLSTLIGVVAERKIPAIFVESSVPHRLIESLQAGVKAKGFDVALGGELYSDALGPTGSGAESYEGMVRHNVNTIVTALSRG